MIQMKSSVFVCHFSLFRGSSKLFVCLLASSGSRFPSTMLVKRLVNTAEKQHRKICNPVHQTNNV